MRCTLTALGLLSLIPLTGCAAAALGTAAVMINQEFISEADIYYIEAQPEETWAQTQATLTAMSLDPIQAETREGGFAAAATVDAARVTVFVTRYDSERTKLCIGAKKWGMYNSNIATKVAARIKRELETP